MADKRCLRIVVMDTGVFLYLPMFYAAARDFFGHAGRDWACDVQSAFPRTDEAAIRALTQRSPTGEFKADFVVCDPVAMLGLADPHQVCLLAALVTNGAFWAVNHDAAQARTLADLAKFNRIITFEKGSTSHRIATQAFKYAGRDPRITETHPGDELVLLTKSDRETVALTPNVLDIAALGQEYPSYTVNFDLGRSSEFAGQLVSGVMARADFVRENKELVVGVLRGIQYALDACRSESEDVIEFAQRRFQEGRERIIAALHRANETQLFPASIEVTRAQWLTAVRVTKGALAGKLDTDVEVIASRIFDAQVAPFAHHAVAAARTAHHLFVDEGASTVLPAPEPRFVMLRPIPFAATAVGLGVAVWAAPWPPSALATWRIGVGIVIAALGISYWLGSHFGTWRDRPVQALVTLCASGIVVPTALYWGGVLGKDTLWLWLQIAVPALIGLLSSGRR